MPQIKSDDLPEFLSFVKDNGVIVQKETYPARKLKPIQSEIDLEKVDQMNDELAKKKVIIVSGDNFILDGHHRWYYSYLKNEIIPIVRVKITAKELLVLSKSFDKTMYKSL